MAGARLEAGVRGVARPGGGRRALDGDARVGPDAGRGAPGLRGGAGPGPRYGFGRLCARATTRARSRSSVRIERDQESFASPDRKSTRLNSSHLVISYAVFCL